MWHVISFSYTILPNDYVSELIFKNFFGEFSYFITSLIIDKSSFIFYHDLFILHPSLFLLLIIFISILFSSYIPETLAARGKVRLSAKQLGGMIGEVYVIRHDVNLHSEILGMWYEVYIYICICILEVCVCYVCVWSGCVCELHVYVRVICLCIYVFVRCVCIHIYYLYIWEVCMCECVNEVTLISEGVSGWWSQR